MNFMLIVLLGSTLVAAVRCSTDACVLTKCKGPEYHLNPYTGTCIRQVRLRNNYDAAKAYCRAAGENLAVFDTNESLNFMKHLRKTAANFDYIKSGGFLFGARKIKDTWRHDGRITSPVTNMDWEADEPSDIGECLMMGGKETNYKVRSQDCHSYELFLCERRARF